MFWQIVRTASVFAIYNLLSLNLKAAEIPEYNSNSFQKQTRNSSNISNRQEKFSDNLLINNIAPRSLAQVNNVKQFRDVEVTDWSYEALRSLSERYDCISGFPDGTYRGERAVSRAEFAAGLNACLNKIDHITALSDEMPQTDVDTVLRLMQEFQSELAILQGRTDGSQARVGDLEATQFSTTTKLRGEAIFGLGGVLSEGIENDAVFGSRLRLDFVTSFEGDDLLFTRLSRNDFQGFAEEVGTFQGNLAFAEVDEDEDLRLDELHYSFGIGDRLRFIVGAAGIDAEDIAGTINYLDGDGGSGSISRFGTRNPLYYSPEGAGLGITHSPIDQIEISAGYLASAGDEPSSGGLFNGPYSALGQIAIAPLESLSLAATYIHSYNQSDTETGTTRANLQFQTEELFGEEVPTVSNSYGLELSWAISDRIIIGGRGGLSKVSNLNTLNGQIDRGTQDIWNWAATLALPDLGKEGSLAGIVVGSEPRVTESTIDALGEDEQSLHLEAFYQYQINDNISVTPGVVWITEPNSDIQNSDDLVIGTVRTTFSF